MDPISAVGVVLLIVVAVVLVVAWGRSRRSRMRGPSTEAARVGEIPRLRDRLTETRNAVQERLSAALRRDSLDDRFWEELEEALIAADVGVETSAQVVGAVRAKSPRDGEAARQALDDELCSILSDRDRTLHLGGKPAVILVVGVNGSGKTTSIAKLAHNLQGTGATVLIGAADTFRAAADEQMRTWGHRAAVDVVAGQAGADPASVAFDAFQAAKSRQRDVVIIDTAGRLQTKGNLMDELAKVARVMEREAGELHEVLLVLDGTTGQNAIAQAQSFTAAVGVTGIVITKLDGTAKGGIAVAIERDLDIPVKLIGVGEGLDDLVAFYPTEYVAALIEP